MIKGTLVVSCDSPHQNKVGQVLIFSKFDLTMFLR